MPVTVRIPTVLRKYAAGQAKVEVAGAVADEALESLISLHPELKSHLYDDSGQLRSFINIFVGTENLRDLPERHPLAPHEELSIVPAVAGGGTYPAPPTPLPATVWNWVPRR